MFDHPHQRPALAEGSLTVPGDTQLYYGILNPGTAQPMISSPVKGWQQFVTIVDSYMQQGNVLVSADEYLDGDDSVFVGTFMQQTNVSAVTMFERSLDWKDIQQTINRNPYARIISISARPLAQGLTSFVVVWLDSTSGQTVVTAPSYAAFEPLYQAQLNNGNRLVVLAVYNSKGNTAFIGVFEPNPTRGYAIALAPTWAVFENIYASAQADGNGLVDLQIFDDPTGQRWYDGVFLQGSSGTVIAPCDWTTFSTILQSLKGVVSVGVVPGLPQPTWSTSLSAALSNVQGYSWAAGYKGSVVQSGQAGDTRSANPADSPQTAWSAGSLCNIASVTKPITAIATLQWLNSKNLSLDTTFSQYLAPQIQVFGPGVANVTFRQLLQMRSGLEQDNNLYTSDFWDFLRTYLAKPVTSTYTYSNTNFTILQAVLELNTPNGYAEWVTTNILSPLGLDATVITPTALPQQQATLSYKDNLSTAAGDYWPTITFLGAGGWIATATAILQILNGLRTYKLLPASLTAQMFDESLGVYTFSGQYGLYYYHDGGLDALSGTRMRTGFVHFSNGFDLALLVNSAVPDVIKTMIDAFQG